MIAIDDFKGSFASLFAEMFGVTDAPHGYILDNGQNGMLGTVDRLSAEVASAAPSAEQSTIASHTAHVLYLLQFFAAYERGETPTPDWPGSWKTRIVNDAEWQALRADLRAAYEDIVAKLMAREEWPVVVMSSTMMLLAHCSYHVGEIRQRLLWVGQ